VDLKRFADEDEAAAHQSLDMHAVVPREFPKSCIQTILLPQKLGAPLSAVVLLSRKNIFNLNRIVLREFPKFCIQTILLPQKLGAPLSAVMLFYF
jgi:hypothetical protein